MAGKLIYSTYLKKINSVSAAYARYLYAYSDSFKKNQTTTTTKKGNK